MRRAANATIYLDMRGGYASDLFSQDLFNSPLEPLTRISLKPACHVTLTGLSWGSGKCYFQTKIARVRYASDVRRAICILTN